MAPFNTTLPSNSSLARAASLYFFQDGILIFNRTEIVSEYNITIYLNKPFAPFLDLLCFEASKILSPASTPAIRFIELYERPIGTGPFRFISYTPGVEVRFERWNNYWRTRAYIYSIVFALISSNTMRNNAMLNHQIDYILGYSNSLINTFKSDPTIHVEDFTDNTGKPELSYYYLGMNNNLLNITWRKAISYAINYSYIIEIMQNNSVIRANSPISPSFGEECNGSVDAVDYNLFKARQVLKDALIPGTEELVVTNDTLGPDSDAWKNADLLSLNYSYNREDSFRSSLFLPLAFWLDQIGITLVNDSMTTALFLDILYENPNRLGIFWSGESPDYLDSFNLLNILFNPASKGNFAQVNDTWLINQMDLALYTTNDENRNLIYKNIQSYLANDLYPHVFGYYKKLVFVHDAHLRGVAYNAINKFTAYLIYRI